jgi:transcriptional regulator with XRE-family HTH domain
MARKKTRFGEQPIRSIVRRRHWNLKLIAYETGVAYSHLINAANGITPPSPQLRKKLSEFLGLPVEKLFSTDALAATYSEGRARGGKISRRYGRRAA